MTLKTVIEREGQEYLDEPVRAFPRPIVNAVAMAFGRQYQAITVRHERVALRWMKPTANGLVPKGEHS